MPGRHYSEVIRDLAERQLRFEEAKRRFGGGVVTPIVRSQAGVEACFARQGVAAGNLAECGDRLLVLSLLVVGLAKLEQAVGVIRAGANRFTEILDFLVRRRSQDATDIVFERIKTDRRRCRAK